MVVAAPVVQRDAAKKVKTRSTLDMFPERLRVAGARKEPPGTGVHQRPRA